MQKQEYQQLVKSCFIGEENPRYDLMRVGLELAEEYLELHYYSLLEEPDFKEELNELGDVYFWLTYLADFLGFDLEVSETENIPEEYFTDPLVHCKNILGNIKRFYRDKNIDKLIELPKLVNNMLNSLIVYYDYTEEELIEVNSEKMARRKANNTISGEGAR